MTLPDERYRAVKWAESFLTRLAGGHYARVPKAVREEARSILRHYPSTWDLDRAAHSSPSVFESPNKLDDLQVFILDGRAKTK